MQVESLPLDITIRVGCHLVYDVPRPVAALFALRVRSSPHQNVLTQKLTLTPENLSSSFLDSHGNLTDRLILQKGENIVHHDALVAVSSKPDNFIPPGKPKPVWRLPDKTLRFTLPSRYCDSDKLLNIAWQQFGSITDPIEQVRAICDWTHNNIEYRFGAGRSDTAASDVVTQRFGVCRDFAHVAIALCRTMNIPARYVTGHLPDVGHKDPGTPMDFHAYFEAFIGDRWSTFDARFNSPRIGRIKIAEGRDAVDGAFATIYGQAQLTWFEVWAYQVDPEEVRIGDPVDLSKRLDGVEKVRVK